jgi:hypothetical protein
MNKSEAANPQESPDPAHAQAKQADRLSRPVTNRSPTGNGPGGLAYVEG